jgi:hypothetical protein
MAKYPKALIGAILITAALLFAVLGGIVGSSLHTSTTAPVAHNVCVIPTANMYPPAPSGGLGFVDWTMPAHGTVFTAVVDVNHVAPTTFIQLDESTINGQPEYFGLQELDATHGLFIFSRFGVQTDSYIRPAAGAYSVVGTTEGPLASVRQDTTALHGDYVVTVDNDGGGWYGMSVNGQSVGSLNFGVGTGFSTKGSSWLEDFGNNGSTFVRPGLTEVSITVSAAKRGVTAYSDVPDTNIFATGATVHFTTGGNTARCDTQGQVAS